MAIPLIIAHRGASLECPENSLQAYRRAIAVGSDYVEIDLHLTRDGIPVCHHDEHIGSGPLSGRRIGDCTLAQLKSAAVGEAEIPTFAEVLGLSFGSSGLLVELKEGDADLVAIASRMLQRSAVEKALVGTFSISMMAELLKLWPQAQLIGIVEEETRLAEHMGLRPRYLAIDVAVASPERVRVIQGAGIEVLVWTVDDPTLASSLVHQGVCGIITNDPERMVKIR